MPRRRPEPRRLATIEGDDLRRAVLDVLADWPDHRWPVAQIVRQLAAEGRQPGGDRPCRVVADVVWAEIADGRIRQAGLAAYRLTDGELAARGAGRASLAAAG